MVFSFFECPFDPKGKIRAWFPGVKPVEDLGWETASLWLTSGRFPTFEV
jgi:hypothetical protein